MLRSNLRIKLLQDLLKSYKVIFFLVHYTLFPLVLSGDQIKKLQHILDANDSGEKGMKKVMSLMEKYIAYKNNYVKNIKFDASNENLSKC